MIRRWAIFLCFRLAFGQIAGLIVLLLFPPPNSASITDTCLQLERKVGRYVCFYPRPITIHFDDRIPHTPPISPSCACTTLSQLSTHPADRYVIATDGSLLANVDFDRRNRQYQILSIADHHPYPYEGFPHQSTLASLRRGLMHGLLTLTIS